MVLRICNAVCGTEPAYGAATRLSECDLSVQSKYCLQRRYSSLPSHALAGTIILYLPTPILLYPPTSNIRYWRAVSCYWPTVSSYAMCGTKGVYWGAYQPRGHCRRGTADRQGGGG
eukprot:2535357-Rhodomonas_salina.3